MLELSHTSRRRMHRFASWVLRDKGSCQCDSCRGMTVGPLLQARLAWEAANPRPESLRRVERMIVRGLKDEGLGPQSQVTHECGFEIACDDVLIRVEYSPDDARRAS